MPPKKLVLYQVQYYDAHRQTWMKSSWKMTEEDAQLIYAKRQYRLLPETEEVMHVDGNLNLSRLALGMAS